MGGSSSPPPVARTRAQARAVRAELAPSPVASHSGTITTHVSRSGPWGISPLGPPVVKGGPTHVVNSHLGGRKQRNSGTSGVASYPAFNPICRSPLIVVPSADGFPQPIPTPPLMPPAVTSITNKPYGGRRYFRRDSSVLLVNPFDRRVLVSVGPGVTSAHSLVTVFNTTFVRSPTVVPYRSSSFRALRADEFTDG